MVSNTMFPPRSDIDMFNEMAVTWAHGPDDPFRDKLTEYNLPVPAHKLDVPKRRTRGLYMHASIDGASVCHLNGISKNRSVISLGEPDGSIACLRKGNTDLRPIALLDTPHNTKAICIGQVAGLNNRFRYIVRYCMCVSNSTRIGGCSYLIVPE
jgi:hypothetical protein